MKVEVHFHESDIIEEYLLKSMPNQGDVITLGYEGCESKYVVLTSSEVTPVLSITKLKYIRVMKMKN